MLRAGSIDKNASRSMDEKSKFHPICIGGKSVMSSALDSELVSPLATVSGIGAMRVCPSEWKKVDASGVG